MFHLNPSNLVCKKKHHIFTDIFTTESGIHQEWQAEIKYDRRRKGKREVHGRKEMLRESLDTSHAHWVNFCNGWHSKRWLLEALWPFNDLKHMSRSTEWIDLSLPNHKSQDFTRLLFCLSLGCGVESHLSPFTPPHAIDCFSRRDCDHRRRTRHAVGSRRSTKTRPWH